MSFLKKVARNWDMKGRINLIEHHSVTLSIREQCSVLGVSRSSLYCKPKEEKAKNQEMMLRMDKHLINHPTEGVNSMVYWLTALGFVMGTI